MLILSRKVGERISIGEDIQIKITHLSSGRVQIGIDAPRAVSIQRCEFSQPIDEVVTTTLPRLKSITPIRSITAKPSTYWGSMDD